MTQLAPNFKEQLLVLLGRAWISPSTLQIPGGLNAAKEDSLSHNLHLRNVWQAQPPQWTEPGLLPLAGAGTGSWHLNDEVGLPGSMSLAELRGHGISPSLL